MARFQQSFTRKGQRWKLNATFERLEKDEEIELQEQMNSHLDDLLYAKLEQAFDEYSGRISFDSAIDEDVTSASKVDAVLDAISVFEDIKDRYNLPENLSNQEVIDYIRSAISRANTEKKGGVDNAQISKNDEQESE